MIANTDLWHDYENRLIELFTAALLLLRAGMPVNAVLDEDDINRRLSLCLRSANFELLKDGRGFESPPVLTAPMQPHLEDPVRTPQESKLPDFQHQLMDGQAPTVESSCICYHVECKRLGRSSSTGAWFPRDYVIRGVARFRDDSHRYGHRCRSGAMIGYVQNLGTDDTLSFDDILSLVNAANQRSDLGLITLLPPDWSLYDVTRLHQSLARQFPVTPFRLHHLWLDMRYP